MAVVNYTKPVAGDARTAASINSITDEISTESTNIQTINLAQGGVEKRNLQQYSTRRTGSISSTGISGTLTNTSFSDLVIGGTTIKFDTNAQWGGIPTLGDKDAIRVYASFYGEDPTQKLSIAIASLQGSTTATHANTERVGKPTNGGYTTLHWIQPSVGANVNVSWISLQTKLASSGGYKAGYATLVVTLFRNIGRIS